MNDAVARLVAENLPADLRETVAALAGCDLRLAEAAMQLTPHARRPPLIKYGLAEPDKRHARGARAEYPALRLLTDFLAVAVAAQNLYEEQSEPAVPS